MLLLTFVLRPERAKLPKHKPTVAGLIRFLSHTAIEVAVVGSHKTWETVYRLRRTLDPAHLKVRLEALKQRIEDDVALASHL